MLLNGHGRLGEGKGDGMANGDGDGTPDGDGAGTATVTIPRHPGSTIILSTPTNCAQYPTTARWHSALSSRPMPHAGFSQGAPVPLNGHGRLGDGDGMPSGDGDGLQDCDGPPIAKQPGSTVASPTYWAQYATTTAAHAALPSSIWVHAVLPHGESARTAVS